MGNFEIVFILKEQKRLLRKKKNCIMINYWYAILLSHNDIDILLGLGTSTSDEAKEYFTDIARHRIKFK